MPSFDELFYDHLTNKEVESIDYKDKNVIRMDRLAIPRKCRLKIRIVATNSEWKQGIRLNIDGNFTLSETRLGKKLILWEDTAARDTTIDA